MAKQETQKNRVSGLLSVESGQEMAGGASRKKVKWELTGEALEKLLDALDSDRTRAGVIYGELRIKLMWYLERKGCRAPEEYADKALNILAKHLAKGETFNNISSYVMGIANMLLKEMGRDRVAEQLEGDKPSTDLTVEVKLEREELFRCLHKCLNELSEEDRSLFLRYFEGEGRERIAERQRLSKELRCTMNKLRIIICRMNVGLRACLSRCMGLTDVNDRTIFIALNKGGN